MTFLVFILLGDSWCMGPSEHKRALGWLLIGVAFVSDILLFKEWSSEGDFDFLRKP